LINKQLNSAKLSVVAPPAKLGITGRVGIVTVKIGLIQLFLVVTYFMPRSHPTQDILDTATRITDHVQAVYDEQCLRSVFYMGGDINDQFGKEKHVTGILMPTQHAAVGPKEPAPEGINAHIVKTFCKANYLSIASTFYRTGPTYYGIDSTSKIDHLITNTSNMPNIQ